MGKERAATVAIAIVERAIAIEKSNIAIRIS